MSTAQQLIDAGAALALEVLDARETRMAQIERVNDAPAGPAVARARGPLELAQPQPALGPRGLRVLARPAPRGYLIAEGDSWFDYPRSDILDVLEAEHGYRIEKLANAGDTVEDMAYNPEQIDRLAQRYERLLEDGKPVHAILLSGGGNDIAGDEFSMMLEHRRSERPGLNAVIVDEVFNGRLRSSFLRIFGVVMKLSQDYLGRQVPIILHGYDYVVPDGRGVLGGFWVLPGPWLLPAFERKGYEDPAERLQLMRELMDRFNTLLAGLVGDPALRGTVRYVDLRRTLSTGADYRKDWANEMHPKPDGFRALAARIASQL
jgi:hypothetical protein